jgi:hypothetical protein
MHMRLSPYCAANYLLSRVYESGKQLQQSAASTRIALIATWFTFERQLNDGWINWKNPAFMDVYDPSIDYERKKNPNFDDEMN